MVLQRVSDDVEKEESIKPIRQEGGWEKELFEKLPSGVPVHSRSWRPRFSLGRGLCGKNGQQRECGAGVSRRDRATSGRSLGP